MGRYGWTPTSTKMAAFDVKAIKSGPSKFFAKKENLKLLQPRNSNNPEFKYPFIQNYIHDAEAIWWILCWFLLATQPSSELPAPTPEILKRRKAMWYLFFPGHDVRANRISPWKNPFLDRSLQLHNDLPASYEFMYQFVCGPLRNIIVETYESAESLPDRFNTEAMSEVHNEMEEWLTYMAQQVEKINIGNIKYAEYVILPKIIQGQKYPSHRTGE